MPPAPPGCWLTSRGRTAASVAAWLTDQPAPWRERITHVAIDLSAS